MSDDYRDNPQGWRDDRLAEIAHALESIAGTLAAMLEVMEEDEEEDRDEEEEE